MMETQTRSLSSLAMKNNKMYCLSCPYSDFTIDKLKCHIFKEHPSGLAVVTDKYSQKLGDVFKMNVTFICIKQSCTYFSSRYNVYEDHLATCCSSHDRLSTVEAERLKQSIKFILDLEKLHFLSNFSRFLDLAYSLQDTSLAADACLNSMYGALAKKKSKIKQLQNNVNLLGVANSNAQRLNFIILPPVGNTPGLHSSNIRGPRFIVPAVKNPQAHLNVRCSVNNNQGQTSPKAKADGGHIHLAEGSKTCKQDGSNSNEKPNLSKVVEEATSSSTHEESKNIVKKMDALNKQLDQGPTCSPNEKSPDSTPNANHICPFCYWTFPNASSFEIHLRKRHGEENDNDMEDIGKDESESDKFLILESKAEKEMYLTHLIETQALLDHDPTLMETSTNDEESGLVTRDVKPVILPDGTFQSAEDRPFKCDDCRASFGQEDLLLNHMKIHSEKKVYVCTECNKVFIRSTDIRVHIRVHTKEKPFKCPLCDRGFGYKHSLNKHMKTHSWSCDHECIQDFRMQVDDDRINSNVSLNKAFTCEICNRSYKNKATLCSHMSFHKGRPYTCPICGKIYSRKYDLHRHMRVHSGDKPYKCNICKMGFLLKSKLLSHMRSHDPNNMLDDQILHQILEDDTDFRNSAADSGNTNCDGQSLSKNIEEFQGSVKTVDSTTYSLRESVRNVHEQSKGNKSACLTTYHAEVHTAEKSINRGENVNSRKFQNCSDNHDLSDILSDDVVNKQSCSNICDPEIHQETPPKNKNYYCKECNLIFDTFMNWYKHIVLHDGAKNCLICGKKFARSFDLHRHIRIHMGEKPFKCNQCHMNFQYKYSLINHKKRHSQEVSPNCKWETESEIQELTSSCESVNNQGIIPSGRKARILPQVKDISDALKETLEAQAERNVFECIQCHRKFSDITLLQTHLKLHSVQKLHRCLECGKRFSSQAYLIDHQERHSRETPLQCNICNKNFTNRIDYFRHKKEVHAGEKPYKCQECPKRYTRRFDLICHMRVHTGEKPFKCEICGRGFSLSCNLKVHVRGHSGDKPFLCNICGKSFSMNSGLELHMRIHTNEKPFKCDVCERCFSEKRRLKSHMRVHTGERPYLCNICGKSYRFQPQFFYHKKMHTGEKPYKCNECDKAFVESYSLKKHKRIHKKSK